MIDVKRQNREALDWILNFHDKRKAYAARLNDFSVLSAVAMDGMPHGTDPGNPCQNKGISLVELEQMKKWIMTIEQMEQTLGEKSKEFLRLWRLAEQGNEMIHTIGRPGWYNEVRNGYAEFFQKKYGMYFLPSNGTLKTWRLRIIDITVRIAIKNGAL